MQFHWIHPYPALPEDTRQSARMVYGQENSYIKMGDSLDILLRVLISPNSQPFCMLDNSFETTIQCAMLTIFQFLERLSNRQIVEAASSRVEIKYALHLPLTSPRLDPHILCEFRRQLFTDSKSQQFFRSFLELLGQFNLLEPVHAQPATVDQLLVTICTLNRLDEVLDAIYQGIQALAVTNPDWLRQVALAQWYDRYNPNRQLPLIQLSDEQWKSRSLRMAADIQYLLEEIDQSNDPKLTALQEVLEIRRIWQEQFIISAEGTGQRIWMLTRCASCSPHSRWEEVQ